MGQVKDWTSSIATSFGFPDPNSHYHHSHDTPPPPPDDDSSD